MSKAGVIEEEDDEEEEEEEEQQEPEVKEEKALNLSAPNSSTNSIEIETKSPEINVENNPPETTLNDTSSDYFSGKTTKEGLNFVRNVQKLQTAQNKAYSSVLDKMKNSLSTAREFASKPLTDSQITTTFSQDSKKNYQNLRNQVLSLTAPKF